MNSKLVSVMLSSPVSQFFNYNRFIHKLEDSLNDQLMDEPLAIEEIGHLAAKHYRDQFALHNFD